MELVVTASPAIDVATRTALRELWAHAYGDRFSDDDADHAYGGVHVLAKVDGHLVGHASAIPRRVQFGAGPWQEIGYVEAVAVEPEFQGRGLGRQVMQALHDEMRQRWSLAMLSTGRATTFYEALGWQRWQGLSYTMTAAGPVEDGEHGGLMLLRLSASESPNLASAVTCEDRPGDAW